MLGDIEEVMLEKMLPGEDREEARRLQRYKVNAECQVESESGAHPGKLSDLSPIGARVETDASAEVDDTVTLKHPAAGSVTGRVVRVEDGAIALEFAMDAASVSFSFKIITEPMLRATSSVPAEGGAAKPKGKVQKEEEDAEAEAEVAAEADPEPETEDETELAAEAEAEEPKS